MIGVFLSRSGFLGHIKNHRVYVYASYVGKRSVDVIATREWPEVVRADTRRAYAYPGIYNPQK